MITIDKYVEGRKTRMVDEAWVAPINGLQRYESSPI